VFRGHVKAPKVRLWLQISYFAMCNTFMEHPLISLDITKLEVQWKPPKAMIFSISSLWNQYFFKNGRSFNSLWSDHNFLFWFVWRAGRRKRKEVVFLDVFGWLSKQKYFDFFQLFQAFSKIFSLFLKHFGGESCKSFVSAKSIFSKSNYVSTIGLTKN